MILTEHQEQSKVIQWLNLKKLYFFAIPNANAMSSLSPKMATIQMAKLKREGFRSGASDLVVFTNTKIIFIEMKRSKKSLSKVSDSQIEFLANIKRFEYADSSICYGFDEAIRFIELYL